MCATPFLPHSDVCLFRFYIFIYVVTVVHSLKKSLICSKEIRKHGHICFRSRSHIPAWAHFTYARPTTETLNIFWLTNLYIIIYKFYIICVFVGVYLLFLKKQIGRWWRKKVTKPNILFKTQMHDTFIFGTLYFSKGSKNKWIQKSIKMESEGASLKSSWYVY